MHLRILAGMAFVLLALGGPVLAQDAKGFDQRVQLQVSDAGGQVVAQEDVRGRTVGFQAPEIGQTLVKVTVSGEGTPYFRPADPPVGPGRNLKGGERWTETRSLEVPGGNRIPVQVDFHVRGRTEGAGEDRFRIDLRIKSEGDLTISGDGVAYILAEDLAVLGVAFHVQVKHRDASADIRFDTLLDGVHDLPGVEVGRAPLPSLEGVRTAAAAPRFPAALALWGLLFPVGVLAGGRRRTIGFLALALALISPAALPSAEAGPFAKVAIGAVQTVLGVAAAAMGLLHAVLVPLALGPEAAIGGLGPWIVAAGGGYLVYRGIRNIVGGIKESRALDELGDPNPVKRMKGANTLGTIRARSALRPLLGRLADPQPAVRAAVYTALAEIGEPAALPHVRTAAAREEDPFAREAAEAALHDLEGEEAEGILGAIKRTVR